MTLPTFSQSGTAATSTAALSVNGPLPATVANDEVAIWRICISNTGLATITWPAGWTQIDQRPVGLTFSMGVAWKRLTTGDGGTTPVATFDLNSTSASRITTYLGCVATGTPFEASAANSGDSTSQTSSAFTTTGVDRLGVNIFGAAGSGTSTVPGGWTQDQTSQGSTTRTYWDHKNVAAATTESAVTRTVGVSSKWIVVTFALMGREIFATAAADFGALAGSAAATVEHPATLAAPLGSLAGSASATVEHPATLAATFGALAGSASATVEHSATLAAPLGSLAGSASATVEHSATLAAPLGALSAAAAFTVEHLAALDAPLGGLAGSALFVTPGLAILDAPLGELDGAAAFTVEHLATLDAPLGALDLQATFVASTPASARRIEVVAGPLNRTLDFNPRRSRLQRLDQALVVLSVTDASGPIDLSSALLVEFLFQTPTGALLVRRATIGAALGRVEYRLAADELDQAGDWLVQARAIKATGAEVRTRPRRFAVAWNLPTS